MHIFFHISSCYGEPFMPLPISKYANMLYSRLENSNIKVWLVNTGWIGGNYHGSGKRIKLEYTRALINSVLEDKTNEFNYALDPNFGIQMVTTCTGIVNSDNILDQSKIWGNETLYHEEALLLVKKFHKNFEKFSNDPDIYKYKEGGPIKDASG